MHRIMQSATGESEPFSALSSQSVKMQVKRLHRGRNLRELI